MKSEFEHSWLTHEYFFTVCWNQDPNKIHEQQLVHIFFTSTLLRDLPFPLTLSTLISYSSFLFFFILSHLFSQSAPQILLLIEAHGLWVSRLSPDFLCLYTSLPVKSALCPCLCFSDDAQTSWITRSPLLPWILLLALQLA